MVMRPPGRGDRSGASETRLTVGSSDIDDAVWASPPWSRGVNRSVLWHHHNRARTGVSFRTRCASGTGIPGCPCVSGCTGTASRAGSTGCTGAAGAAGCAGITSRTGAACSAGVAGCAYPASSAGLAGCALRSGRTGRQRKTSAQRDRSQSAQYKICVFHDKSLSYFAVTAHSGTSNHSELIRFRSIELTLSDQGTAFETQHCWMSH